MTLNNSFLNEQIDSAYERGRNWAHKAAALTLSPEDAEYLENDAKAMARRLPSTPFDPAVNVEDKPKADEYDKNLRDLDDAEMAFTHAAVEVRQREQELANLGREDCSPQAPTWLTVGGITFFAAGFTFGIYDWVHERVSDAYLAALVASIPSVALGVFVVRCLTNPDSPRKRTFGLLAGIGVSVATGVLRYAFAPDEWLIAIALTLLEVVVVLFLDWYGRHLQPRYHDWLVKHEARGQAEHRLEAARQHQSRAEQRVVQLKLAIAKHLEEVAIRSLCFQKFSEIEAALVNAILAGAHKGMAENQGLKRGVMPTSNSLQPVGQ